MPIRRIKSFGSDVSAFVRAVSGVPLRARGRLIVAIDATASREPTWAAARRLHADLFTTARAAGGLEVQLAYFRGRRDFVTSPWTADAEGLAAALDGVGCLPGFTQVGKVLAHAAREATGRPVHAVVYVGDGLEEPADPLYDQAQILAVLGVPVFVLQEGDDAEAAAVFRRIADITGGAWCSLDERSPNQLRQLLLGAAVFAAGGREALEGYARLQGEAGRLLAKPFAGPP